MVGRDVLLCFVTENREKKKKHIAQCLLSMHYKHRDKCSNVYIVGLLVSLSLSASSKHSQFEFIYCTFFAASTNILYHIRYISDPSAAVHAV